MSRYSLLSLIAVTQLALAVTACSSSSSGPKGVGGDNSQDLIGGEIAGRGDAEFDLTGGGKDVPSLDGTADIVSGPDLPTTLDSLSDVPDSLFVDVFVPADLVLGELAEVAAEDL